MRLFAFDNKKLSATKYIIFSNVLVMILNAWRFLVLGGARKLQFYVLIFRPNLIGHIAQKIVPR